jgi:hypothetical protein
LVIKAVKNNSFSPFGARRHAASGVLMHAQLSTLPQRGFDVAVSPPRERIALGGACTNQASAGKGTSRTLALRLAETSEDREGAGQLLNRRFAWRGYGSEHEIPNDESHTTFIALADEQIVGTITLGVDVGGGLAVDSVFKDEIDRFRAAPGAQVCELIKFAFDTELPDQQNLAMLFHTVFLYGLQNHRCTDLFIEVNPRHRRFYQSMLGFTPVGDLRTNPSVDAPSQLMWLNVSDVAESIASCRSDAGTTRTRSLYALFLSQGEESVIKQRLEERKRCDSLRGHNLIERSFPLAGVSIATG